MLVPIPTKILIDLREGFGDEVFGDLDFVVCELLCTWGKWYVWNVVEQLELDHSQVVEPYELVEFQQPLNFEKEKENLILIYIDQNNQMVNA